jgi:regulator of cell morphogenesis and NO signaling
MSRFGLTLGFGDQTVKEVCEKHGVDTHTFLAVANFMENESCSDEDLQENISIESLIYYLQQAHSYFLDFNLPTIRRKLLEAIDYSKNEVALLILRFYDEYVNEVRKHMEYENKVVFQYVTSLLKGGDTQGYNIRVFEDKHNQIAEKLSDLKNIIIKYYPSDVNNNRMNSVLFDIFSCEKDLNEHCRVEDYMFVPLIKQQEERLGHGRS